MAVLLDSAQALMPRGTRNVQFGATATTATGAFASRLIRLHTTAAVCLDLDGQTGTAATTDFPMAADQTEYIRVATSWILSAIARSSTATGVIGTVYWTEA